MKFPIKLCLAMIFCFLMAPAYGDPHGRYSAAYKQDVRPLLKLPTNFSRDEERKALGSFLAQTDLPASLRYLAQRQFLYLSELKDRQGFEKVSRQIQPKPDDYLLLGTLALYDKSLDYRSLVDRLEKYFEQAVRHEPATEVAAWIANDALGVMTENYDFGRASSIVQKAIASLPEESSVLRSLLLGAIARLYVDPGNSPAIVRQGLAIYAENEARMRKLGNMDEVSINAYNQGIGVLFVFGDAQKALEHFSHVGPDSVYAQDALVFSALARVHLGQELEAKAALRKLDFNNYQESPMRLSFLRCYVEIVRSRLGNKADLNLCIHLPESTQADVIQHMTDEILELPLSPAIEMGVLRQFQSFYRRKISPENKLRTAQSVDGLELARARAESDRSRYESKISRIELDLAQKQSQLTAYIAVSTVILLGLISFGFWRRQVQQHRMQKLQQYLQTRILSRFLPPTLVEEIRLGRSRLEEEPQKRIVTILFADLVNFTAKAEQLGTERIARLLNQWMRIATEVVFAENGTIDKFIGDAVMVIYGAPVEISAATQVARTVACARRLMAALEQQNKIWEQDFGISFQLRVGINLGEAIVGSFGSEKRSDYTVIGGAVNLASRIENMAEPGQILLSQSAAQYLDATQLSSIGARQVRGIQGVQELFRVHQEVLQSAIA